MNINNFFYYTKLILIVSSICLTGCNSISQSTKQFSSSFSKLIIFKKQVTAQERRIPDGNKKYVSTAKINKKSNYIVPKNLENNSSNVEENKEQVKKKKLGLFKRDKEIKLETSNQNKVNELEIPNKEIDSKALEGNSNKKKFSLSKIFRKNRPISNIDENSDNNKSDKRFPDLHSVPEVSNEKDPQIKHEMQEELKNLQEESKKLKNDVKPEPLNSQLTETKDVQVLDSSTDLNKFNTQEDNFHDPVQPQILKEIDESGFYSNQKKPASSYLLDNVNNKSVSKKVKLLPKSRYSK
ncbi:MAG: hypothetical protein ACK4OM_03050 [Alphaproteobacteria bacterium]